jgi:hypothetical protein
MAMRNALLAGGAALSLIAGGLVGQSALSPTRGAAKAREMAPFRFQAPLAAEAAQWTPPPTSAPPLQTVAATEDKAAFSPGTEPSDTPEDTVPGGSPRETRATDLDAQDSPESPREDSYPRSEAAPVDETAPTPPPPSAPLG